MASPNMHDGSPEKRSEAQVTDTILMQADRLIATYANYTNDDHGVRTMRLQIPDGVVDPTSFLQHTGFMLTPHPKDLHPKYRQIDYNYNQRGDGIMRRRSVKARDLSGLDFHGIINSSLFFDFEEMVAHSALMTLADSYDFIKKMDFEEAMDQNNRPATVNELIELETFLKTGVVIGPAQ
jgi:hypothetical protein